MKKYLGWGRRMKNGKDGRRIGEGREDEYEECVN